MSESLCGAFSGFVQTIVSHPLDTIKTRIQCNNLHYHGLYKGCMPNLLTNMTQNSMLFSCHSYLYNQSFDHFTSGVVAGSLSSLLINPLELWKIRLQNNKRMCFFSESFKGLRYTFMRDSIGVGIYFFSYHGIKESYDDSFMCGGIAGVLSWVYSYPFDVMKSRIQNNDKITYRHLYKGFPIMILRSFIINSLAFSSFEESLSFYTNCELNM